MFNGGIMFKLFKTNSDINKELQKDNILLSASDFRKELEEKFSEYDYFDLPGELTFDECFMFIYRNIKDLKDSLIIASTLRQIEPTVEDVMKAYSISEDYVNNVVNEIIPKLRVLSYKKLEELPNDKVAFFPDFHNNFEPLYKDLIDRIEYLFEVRRNIQKLFSELNEKKYYSSLINNSSFLFLLNYLSVKDGLIIATSLNIIDIDEEEVQDVYPHEPEYFENIFNTNIAFIESSLSERITKLENIDIETSHFDYEGLCNQYKDLEQRINDTMDYLRDKPKRK